jgi:hypothetical protein
MLYFIACIAIAFTSFIAAICGAIGDLVGLGFWKSALVATSVVIAFFTITAISAASHRQG